MNTTRDARQAQNHAQENQIPRSHKKAKQVNHPHYFQPSHKRIATHSRVAISFIYSYFSVESFTHSINFTTAYVVSGVGGVVKRAFTTYSAPPWFAIVVGMSRFGLVSRLTISPAVNFARNFTSAT